MKTRFHKNIVDIAFKAMPADFHNKFLAGFSHELLLEYCDVPYVSERFNEPEHLHIDHTYKLQLKGCNLHRIGEGDALGEIVDFSNRIKGAAMVNNKNVVKYNMTKATHYIIDIATFPHVNHAVWDKYHDKYEDLADEWLNSYSHLIEELVKNYKPTVMKSVQNRVRAIAERAYFDSMDFLPSFKRSAVISDLQWATMCCNHVYDVMDWFYTFEKYV